MICVNEPGLYRLIFSSRKASAERFKRWLSHEVLPTLRRTGTYSVPEKVTDFYAENLDPRDVTPANRKLVSAWTNCMREVRIAFGEEMARDFYNLSPLPKATGHVTENTRFMVEDGKACLEHMLSTGYTRRGDVPMGAMIEQALHVPSYRKVLSEGGVELNPVGYEGFVAFSIRHPRLERVFALTDWAYDWRTPLLTVPGVTLENICFQGTKKTRAILIPLHVIKGLSS